MKQLKDLPQDYSLELLKESLEKINQMPEVHLNIKAITEKPSPAASDKKLKDLKNMQAAASGIKGKSIPFKLCK